MPLLTRQPEPLHTLGLLVVLALVLLFAAVRWPTFFLHQVLGVH